ncbi:MAG: hypothetical protein AAF371_16530 [Pseudomonadota bacterium]
MLRAILPLALAVAFAAPAAQATVIYDFIGQCEVGCTGDATATIELLDSYVPGSAFTEADLVSFSYASSSGVFNAPADGAFDTASGSLPASSGVTNLNIDIVGSLNIFGLAAAQWTSLFGGIDDSGVEYTLSLREAEIPVPASLPLALGGLALLYGVFRRRA